MTDTSAILPKYKRRNRWAVILAGGEGTRLRPLTRMLTGDDRPKQFCTLLAGKTLLAQTRERVAHGITTDRTLFVLLQTHERFYRHELTGVPSSRMVVQPSNRGTLPAILYSLLRIVRLDPNAVVSFFPSDHYYANEKNFMAGIDLAFQSAEADREALILLGSPATHPETDYGWIEPEAALSSHSRNGLLRVKHFWEKPSLAVAEELFERGCVWNTFVMVGRASAFLDVIRSCAPRLCEAFEFAHAELEPDREAAMNTIYESLPVTDLSSQVLTASPRKLGVLCLGDVGWSDLGDPRRLLGVLSRNGEKTPWLPVWHGDPMRVAAFNPECNSIGHPPKAAAAGC